MISAINHALAPHTARTRSRHRWHQQHAPGGAKVPALYRAASGPDARADPGFRAACSQGMMGDQPGAPGRSGECGLVRWELCSEGLRSRLMSVGRRSFSTTKCGLRVGGHRQPPGRSSSRSPEGREDIAPSGSRIARSAARLGSCTCAGKRIGWVSRAGSPSTDTANARVCAYME